MTVDPRFSSSPTPRSSGPSLTEQTLTYHQRDMTRFRDEPGAASTARSAQEEQTAAAARSLGCNLPAAATKRFDGMAPLERFQAETKHGQQAWTPITSRRRG